MNGAEAGEGALLSVRRVDRCAHSAEHGHWAMTCCVAAGYGHLEVLRCAIKHGCPGGERNSSIDADDSDSLVSP